MKRYLFTNKTNYFFKLIDTAEDMLANPEALDLLNDLMFDCEQQTKTNLEEKGKVMITHSREELRAIIDFNEDWCHRTFNGNQTVFAIQNEDKTVGVILLTINDAEKRRALQVPEDIGTFVYVGDAIIAKEERGNNLFAIAFDKITTMLANPKRELQLPIQYCISMTNAITTDQEFYPMNLPQYERMWQQRFEDNKIQIRLQKDRDQRGAERFEATSEDGFVNRIISDASLEPQEFVRGLYLEGISASYEEMKFKRAQSLARKPSSVFIPEEKRKLKSQESLLTSKIS
jgi:hypothetical protein